MGQSKAYILKGGKYRVKWDSIQFILQERYLSKGEETWRSTGYYREIGQVIRHLVMNELVSTREPLIDAVRDLNHTLRDIVAGLDEAVIIDELE